MAGAQPYQTQGFVEKIAYAAWACADPGLQYDSTINEWHTCPEGGRINASNPCSEYMFLDDTACNLASLNLMQFRELMPNLIFRDLNMRYGMDGHAGNFSANGTIPSKEIAQLPMNIGPWGWALPILAVC
ncbi:MAG: hypothetical protein CM15mP46_5970 [Alphaproteobacteria bacterium]|nr:MAG: hypothetical protein CM15mP46_5970 [Alphaproteobacteria bacterium]